jgi:3-oxoacyl-(acyl-carrier-protein) synthase
MNKIYINSIKQISAQQPLVEEWFDNPIFYSEPYVRAVEPDYKQFFTPNEARRLGKILKRALLVSRQTMAETGVALPDAIITGTGLGCIESTEIFLDKLVRDGEEFLNPTYFMQSTHNTIGSLIAIDTKCHAYNSTYAHKGISFECALQDAFLQMQSGKIQTALIGAHDEMTPAYFALLKKAGYLNMRQSDLRQSDMRQSEIGNRKSYSFAGETAVAMMLSAEKTEKTLCAIEDIDMRYETRDMRHEIQNMRHEKKNNVDCLTSHISHLTSQIDFVMTGVNGNEENDRIYYENCAKLFPNIPLLQYKNIFGESYTAPALGVYAAAICLQKGEIPDFLICDMRYEICGNRKSKILCYNHFENKNHTFTLLSKP